MNQTKNIISLMKEPSLEKKHDAFNYQTEAVDKIKDLPYAAIFHEQGLGKSKIAIDTIIYWLENKEVDTVILVAKKGLVNNWQRELKNHSYLKPRILGNSHKENFEVLNSPSRLILTHYEAISFEKSRLTLFLKTRRVAIVLDEATKIKNPTSKISKVFFDLAPLFQKKIILTGTPVANRPYDIWSQIKFLDGGKSLGNDFENFQKEFDLSNKLSEDPDAKKIFEESLIGLQSKIKNFTVRENKQSEHINLPEKEFINIISEWETKQKILYEKYRDELGASITKNQKIVDDEADEIIKRLLRLVQIASNPALVDESYEAQPGKIKALLTLLDKIKSNGEKVILWSTFTDNVNYLSTKLKNYSNVKLHGKLTMDERNKAVNKFIDDPSCFMFIATPGAAKEGLTLTVANHAIFFDRGFSLDDYLQSQDRIHRVSQTKKCFIYNLIMHDSVDEWVDELLKAKTLAAQLAQGDITYEFYKSKMTYTFSEILTKILNLKKEGVIDGRIY